jgi:hypothetical protein
MLAVVLVALMQEVSLVAQVVVLQGQLSLSMELVEIVELQTLAVVAAVCSTLVMEQPTSPLAAVLE